MPQHGHGGGHVPEGPVVVPRVVVTSVVGLRGKPQPNWI